ncbi:MAG: hypothetical protein JST93_33360 [Acidobacteria bacterium]|nr:hypothetical protein [Acidobacteriota bacterium]
MSAAGSATTALNRTFALDPKVLGPGSAINLQLTGATAADVVAAVAANSPFPARPRIDLASIGLSVSGGNPVAFTAGQTTVGFSFSAGVTAGVGIFDDGSAAVQALGLAETPGLDVTVGAAPSTRYALMRAGYQAQGSVNGTHPIGGIGSVTFGVSGAAAGLSAVLRRFPSSAGARTVLGDTVSSWKLPRHVDDANRLAPDTWLITEASGSLAVNVAARLGYNFNFIRESKALGLHGDIGLKIDAAASAAFGFSVSGRYLLVLGRESAGTNIRLRLFKLSSNGINFGLNLKAGVTGVTPLPGDVDEFVSAVFGVHGSQIVSALQQIEKWTDPSKSVGELVAGLANERALKLIKDVTGIDPKTAFDAARGKLLEGLKFWNELPQRVSAELWGLIGEMGPAESATFKNALQLLASTDRAKQKEALLGILQTNHLDGTPIGRFIGAVGDRGLLALLDRLPEVRSTAQTVLSILDGGIIANLQKQLIEALHLQKVLDTVTKTDFNKLDSFLVGKLSAFFDKELKFEDLNEVKNTINMVVTKRREIYDKVRKALHSRYGVEVAATWSRTTSSTAVLDVDFDTSAADGRALLQGILEDSNIDAVMTSQSTAISVRAAVLTHEIRKKSTLDISLPYYHLSSESFNNAIATVEEDASRVLLYSAKGDDVVKTKNKFRSSLAVTFAASVTRAAGLPQVRIHEDESATWSYQLLQAKSRMKREELETASRPFLNQYMREQFSGDTNLSRWYTQFDQTVENLLHNGAEEFGDVCASYEVTIPGRVLGAWARRVSDPKGAAKQVSIEIQKSLKQSIPFYFFQNVEKYKDLGSSAALLAWSAMRPSTNARLDGDRLIFDEGNDVFWNHPDVGLRRVMARNSIAKANLAAKLPMIRLRLEEAGLSTSFYEDDRVDRILEEGSSGAGDNLLTGLLFSEARIVEKAAEAIRDIQGFLGNAHEAPSKAIVRLSEFAGDITEAFNKLIGKTVFGGVTLRGVNQQIFLEASRALDGSLAVRPSALATFTVLKPVGERTFNIGTFVDGEIPDPKDVLVAQRVISA